MITSTLTETIDSEFSKASDIDKTALVGAVAIYLWRFASVEQCADAIEFARKSLKKLRA